MKAHGDAFSYRFFCLVSRGESRTNESPALPPSLSRFSPSPSPGSRRNSMHVMLSYKNHFQRKNTRKPLDVTTPAQLVLRLSHYFG
ncbi:hypothetical protein TNIN_313431 [Trichonephila inaurata madagascariensis]|uniref:Uncharacterized protein n=1 Tax=Trichonephila inaurata madagascariensis TaxID=2747483 RepID=A0A8X6XAT1_9ARAC|nr:hypothetical protein TNIN_313431 [Trichonephila inaurata madagascariensis]